MDNEFLVSTYCCCCFFIFFVQPFFAPLLWFEARLIYRNGLSFFPKYPFVGGQSKIKKKWEHHTFYAWLSGLGLCLEISTEVPACVRICWEAFDFSLHLGVSEFLALHREVYNKRLASFHGRVSLVRVGLQKPEIGKKLCAPPWLEKNIIEIGAKLNQ